MHSNACRFALTLVLALSAFLALGAKCIENDSLRRDDGGDWHIFGEIHNETTAQGAEIRVVGRLLDANGNTLATAFAPICPFELSPGTFSGYDIHFHDSDGLAPAGHKVNVVSGKVLPGPLPELEATVSNLEAERDGDDVLIQGEVRVLTPIAGDFKACAAFYDSAGKVVSHWTIVGLGPLPSGQTQPLALPLPFVPDEAVTLRFWLVGPGDLLSSNYTSAPSAHVPID